MEINQLATNPWGGARSGGKAHLTASALSQNHVLRSDFKPEPPASETPPLLALRAGVVF